MVMNSPSKVQTHWVGGHHPCENIVSQPKQLKKHMQTKPKELHKKPGRKALVEPKVEKVREKPGPKPKRWAGTPIKFTSGEVTTVAEHCKKLVRHYGTGNTAAKATGVSGTYFKHLVDGTMKDPGEEFLRKIGLKRTVTYEVL